MAVTALEERGFSVEIVDDPDAAREAVLARIPHGSSVMTNISVTLAEAGIADAINDGGPYEPARNAMFALDFATQAQEMKATGGQPDYALGSVHAVTRDGTLVTASASGSLLASHAWGAANSRTEQRPPAPRTGGPPASRATTTQRPPRSRAWSTGSATTRFAWKACGPGRVLQPGGPVFGPRCRSLSSSGPSARTPGAWHDMHFRARHVR